MRVTFEIEEGKPPGTIVGTIPTKPNFTYRFNERPPEFILNGSTGVITTAMEIDREALNNERFDLVILSSSPTYPLEVRIVILDINDNSPSFPEPSIQVAFSESANIGTRVILDTANDRDVGKNDVRTDYRIVSGNDDGKFRLVVTTNPSGETPYLHLETTGRLDRETKAFYSLNISAQDGGVPPRFGFLLLNITILDVNDNPPMFAHSDYSVSLNESVKPGSFVLQVRGTDIDIGDNGKLSYYLSDNESQFTIDPQTGIITTLETLKCQQNCPTQGKCPKSCVFTVFARDHGSPRQDGRAYVTVNLLDANDHDPSIRFRFFPSTANYATVDENTQNGSVVAAVSVIDLDEGSNGETLVEIEGGNELGHFRLESTPSFDIVRVNGVLDREKISKYNLTITAIDRGIPSRSSTAHLIIHVNDVNDHEPIFEKNEYSAVLSEMVPVGTYVAGISATDEDTGVNSDIYYAIVSGNDKRWFDIDAHTGLVTTCNPLNREDQDFVELKISARDGGPNPRWQYTYLRIQILNENDEAPSFAEPIINVTLIESAPPNSLITVVTAVDNDLGTNGSVEYLFHPEVERLYPKKFFLDSTYGRLTLREELDRDAGQDMYELVVIAKDQGTPSLSSTLTVRITLIDVNDNKPYFYPKQYFYALKPTDKPGTIVASLSAIDADVGKNAEVLFNIVSGGNGKFEIDESTGVVKTKAHINKREMSKYEIIVSVRNTDDRKMSDEAVIYIYVDERDNEYRTVEFDHSKGYSFIIDEDNKNLQPNLGREVGRISVSRSVRSGVKYSITKGDPNGIFQIEESTGISTTVRIISSRAVDREVQSKFYLTVVAYDFLGFAETTVNITVADLNDFTPTFEYPRGPIGVKEDWPVGHEVYLVKAHDLDMGPNGRIEFALNSAQAHNTFYIDKNSGMLYLNRPVRFEVGIEYKISVIARDLGIPSLQSSLDLTVIIEDVNDRSPVFDHVAYETSLLESVPVNDRFFLLRATDADYGKNKELTYTLTVGNSENRFGIFPDGYLYVKRPLDREKRDFYSLTVTVQDKGDIPRSSSANIIIHILDENDNSPTFDNKTFEFFIAENEPPDTYVGRLSAEDLDKGRNAELTYTITNTQSDFIINPKTGYIRTLRFFDREQLVEASGHDYLIMDAVVIDGGFTRLRDEVKITVYVTDMNDNFPQFIRVPYYASVSEGSPTGTQVIRIAAVDADDGVNGLLKYSITHGNTHGVFDIDDITGQITVSKTLDRETTSRFILTVMARDLGEDISFNASTTVSIDILDENDNAPVFDIATTKLINISEDALMGSRIVTFSATDTDLGVNSLITYSVASGNFKETFRIDGASGSLYLARPLDYEDKNNYVLNVSASDGGTPRLTSTLQVVVKVLDVNDNAPRFSSTAVVRQIEESIPPNTPVVTLTAQDRDSGVNGKILFNISHQEPPGNHFAVQPETGVLYTTKNIDREFSDTFRLTVVATDLAEDPSMRLSVEKIVTIIVEDINDNPPKFVSMDAGVLPGNVEKGYRIMTLSASDPDANNNGMVTYELEGVKSHESLFSLDKFTGDLYTSRAIDRPAVTYTLTVKATDQAVISVRKSSRNKVTVIGTLRESHSEGPVFFGSAEYASSVLENKPVGTSVLSVRAEYPHGESENQVEYFLTAVKNSAGAPVNRAFVINRFSGVISTASVLDRESGTRIFHLDVFAVDTAAQSPKTSKAKNNILSYASFVS
ncbi:cadherin-related tumor suppressor-like [Uloborus diversus]|uniref:cadherin-related tumor suppressor-like n=1 Tax=Uloborus diversus TaxID=327109 RepID=UPI002409B4E4|nr:cadherin-related tumor suppressor-like [Uloborus diversus]